MERVVKKLDVVRPRIFWKVVQSVDETSKVSVSEKTERAGDFDRIVESLCGNVWLTDQVNARHLSALEFPFHRSQRDRLMIAHHLGLLVTRWKSNKQRCDQAHERSSAEIKFRLNLMKSSERIKGANRSNNKRAGHDRRQLVMGELHKRPRIQK